MREPSAVLLLLLAPLIGALAAGALRRNAALARALTLAVLLAVLGVALHVFFAFAPDATVQFGVHATGIASLGADLHFAVDGFNVYLVLLTGVLFPVVLAFSWNTAEAQRPLYLALLLTLQSALLGAFLAQNLLWFFVCWEAVLIPMSVLIYVFGAQRRREAALTFFLYTLAGGVLLLAAVIALGAAAFQQTGAWSFELSTLYALRLDPGMQAFVFAAIMLACLIKCPLVPFHSWLPLAYTEAPASASALMAGALSKMGAFAILKLAMPLAPDVAAAAAPYLAALAVFSLLYGAVLALTQRDYKRVIAYASLSHMGYIVLGAFSFQHSAMHGAMLQMLSHGVAVAGLFLLLGALEARRGADYRHTTALASAAPKFAGLVMLFVLTSLALPLTSGFTAEFMILFGAFQHGMTAWSAGAGSSLLTIAVLATFGMVLGAAYMLRFARALLFGPHEAAPASTPDLRMRELAALAAPLVIIAWLGLAPATVTPKAQRAVDQLMQIAARPAPVRSADPDEVIAAARSAHDR